MMTHPRLASKALFLFAALACPGCAFTNLVLNNNLMEVEPRRFYRSGQMSPERLSQTMERLEVATVVNLRGEHGGEAWYDEELEAARAEGAAYHALAWSMKRLPEPDSLRRLVAIIEEEDTPILVHCEGGVHRAAAASAVYVLMRGGSADEAREQFGLFFNDAPIGRLVDLYERSEQPFVQWARETYPVVYAAERGRKTAPAPHPSAE